jgi:hypothetical protein
MIAEGTRVYGYDFRRQRYEGAVLWVADDVARVNCDDGKSRLVDVAKLRPVERAAPPPGAVTRPVDRDSISRAATVAVPKAQPVRDRAYLAWLRSQPCCVCGSRADVEASHHGTHGVGSKPSDHDALPLCATHHRRWHDRGSPHPSWEHLTREEKRARFAFLVAEHRARWRFGIGG